MPKNSIWNNGNQNKVDFFCGSLSLEDIRSASCESGHNNHISTQWCLRFNSLSDYILDSFRVTVSSQASPQSSITPRPRCQLRGRLLPAFLLFHLSYLRRSRDLRPTSSSPRRPRVTFSWAPWGGISPGICPCTVGGWAPRSRRPPRPAWGPSTATE